MTFCQQLALTVPSLCNVKALPFVTRDYQTHELK